MSAIQSEKVMSEVDIDSKTHKLQSKFDELVEKAAEMEYKLYIEKKRLKAEKRECMYLQSHLKEQEMLEAGQEEEDILDQYEDFDSVERPYRVNQQ